ncbi:MAG: substrate-binding domain-containing protein, partial [Verrucomicrobiota bacterium]
IRIPEDIAIIGVDNDHNFCYLSCPPLSSIDPNISAVAYNATSRLLQLIGETHPASKKLQDAQPFLIARESTGQRTCSDPLVKQVTNLFEKEAARRPSLSHIASQLGFSLRALETTFQDKCGMTLKDEFLRIQLNEFRQLLRTTDLSIEEMAHQLGWQSSALQTAFRRVMGYTPGQYRKLFRSTTPAALNPGHKTAAESNPQKNIGVILPLTGSCFYEFLQGIEFYCSTSSDIRISLCIPAAAFLLEKGFNDLEDFDRVSNCDGFIIAGSVQPSHTILQPKPTICIDHSQNTAQSWSSCVDNYRAGVLAAEHFLGKGFTQFAYCYPSVSLILGRLERRNDKRADERHAGFLDTLVAAGVLPSNILNCSYAQNDELQTIIKKLNRKTALFAFNDITARLILQECIRQDRRVPEDVAIVGCDNHEFLCQLSNPSLSSVDINFFRAGHACVEQLAAYLLDGKEPDQEQLRISARHVIERYSSASLGTDDEEIRKIVDYISANSASNLSISDILQHSSLSRRGIEKRFRTIMGRSLLDELHRQRIVRACDLLTSSKMSIKEVSHQSGYINTAHFSKIFRKHKNLSPKAFRQYFNSTPVPAATRK